MFLIPPTLFIDQNPSKKKKILGQLVFLLLELIEVNLWSTFQILKFSELISILKCLYFKTHKIKTNQILSESANYNQTWSS